MRKFADAHQEKFAVLELRTDSLVDSLGYDREKYEKLNEKCSKVERKAKSLEESMGSDREKYDVLKKQLSTVEGKASILEDREKQQMLLQRVQSLEDSTEGPKDRALIVTSPEITDNYGNVLLPSLVEPGAREDKETHTDTARRLVKQKTGVDIPTEDIISCHSIEATNTTFRIVFGNTRRNSAFDILSKSIMTGESMTCLLYTSPSPRDS